MWCTIAITKRFFYACAMKHVVIGGGAAGFFTAINLRDHYPEDEIIILEAGDRLLEKVKVSGGGRCNVTHACFEPKELVKHYPRGEKELLGPFHKFQPGDTMAWFEERGVELKIEDDNRVFPVTDKSQTIIDCFLSEAEKKQIIIKSKSHVRGLELYHGAWKITIGGDAMLADKIYICSGSSRTMWDALRKTGHRIIRAVPSLFTFKIKDERLHQLQGISAPHAQVKVEGKPLEATGPVLITHWGLSGPAILKLSAWGAMPLFDARYKFLIAINWLADWSEGGVDAHFETLRQEGAKQKVLERPEFGMPRRLWKNLAKAARIQPKQGWPDLKKEQLVALRNQLIRCEFEVTGKSIFKDEFVTAGGVELSEVDFRTMESKLFPNLFFAGEVLNIDAITGGFNFQNAWTTAYLSAQPN